ncbi:hypothetical protein HMPREF3293_01899 [Christensenella minuta]|uniref:Uncharacterized protein n=1 Tax=Christensenella minuta TaxID=626937 RepID=A0A136Q3R6_9FIRM|nr:hypothetical protein HMPREF3293_01899 [Christensenella minuta]
MHSSISRRLENRLKLTGNHSGKILPKKSRTTIQSGFASPEIF